VLTLWDTVFLSFGSFSLLFAFKKKENEHAGNKQFTVTLITKEEALLPLLLLLF